MGKAGLQIGVTRAQHSGELGHLEFTAAFLARLFIAAVAADFLKRAFAVDSLFQPAQGLFHWLAFLELDFGQN